MKLRSSSVAIVGMAGAFAQSGDIIHYWRNILEEVDCITDVPATHWSIDDYYDPDSKAPDKTYSKRGGFIPPIDFNPLEFGLPPNILEATDVSQLLALVIAKQALADAGYAADNPYAQSTGVILGVSSLKLIEPLVSRLQYPIWRRVLRSTGISTTAIDSIIEKMKTAYVNWQEESFPGYLSNVVAGRITNRLGLCGINCTVDAACASSLASVQLAMHELHSGNCDMMLAGGVDTNNTAMAYLSFSKTPAFTAHSHMRPFDKDSDGMLIGEGLGMLVLKRVEDAERDGDRIYALIRGIGASSDGRSKSIYAPRLEGQILAIRRALQNSACEPSEIDLIEAHGTGTAAGDPTEFSALRSVFGQRGESFPRIAVGTVKSQIGHTKVAAGAASFIKVALGLYHKVLPPTINIQQPHPSLCIDESPFYLNTRTRPWFSQRRRRAGISSFGFGGTNFHAILEEYPSAIAKPERQHPAAYMILVHAADRKSLCAHCEAIAADLTQDDDLSYFTSLIVASKQTTIPVEAARLGFVAATRQEAFTFLSQAAEELRKTPAAESLTLPNGLYYRERGMEVDGKVVALFPGQGSQYVEMGRTLCLNFPIIHHSYAAMDAVLAAHGARPVTEVVFPPPTFSEKERKRQNSTLQATNHAQAAIGAFSMGLYKLLRQAGLRPDFAIGHSLGELTALWAAGVLDDSDFLELLHARGQAMAQPASADADPGAMLAVQGDAEVLAPLLAEYPGVLVANTNSRSQVVVAGSREALELLKSDLTAIGSSATLLPVAAAFHSPFVAHARDPFAARLKSLHFRSPTIPVYANSSAEVYPNQARKIRALLSDHLVNPVKFLQGIEAIHADGGRIFIEIGPGNTLTRMVGDILAGKPHLALALNASKSKDSDAQLRLAYVQLRVAGLQLGDIDPAQPLPAIGSHKPGLTVQVGGNAYISEKTRASFTAALEQNNLTEDRPTAGPSSVKNSASETTMKESPQTTHQEHVRRDSEDARSSAHLKYLQNTAVHSEKYFLLMQQLYGLVSSAHVDRSAMDAFERGMLMFHEQQRISKEVHERYLSGTEAVSLSPQALSSQPVRPRLFVDGAQEPVRSSGAAEGASFTPIPTFPRPSLPSLDPSVRERVAAPSLTAPSAGETESIFPATATASSGLPSDANAIASILLSVISERTGYPLDSLDVSMDLDADLGIDSLKRVEIMAALEGQVIGSLTGLNFEKFAEMRTIGQIAEFLADSEKKTPVN